MTKERESREELPTVARPRARYAALPAFVITVATGSDAGKRLVFDAAQPSRVLIGTSPSCELRLTDREVSRRHAALEITGPELHLVDLGSTNGTFVNGVRIVDAIVQGGESVKVGGTTLTLEPKPNRDGPEPSTLSAFGRLVGASLAMRRLYPFCERLAKSDVPVLIEGETGTGKELLAEALHEASPRASAPFVVFDCSAVTPNLVESQLFGHERGAFTGAASARKGVFELANGGTLFIDEIGDLELSLQARLLRAIEKGEVCRLGSERWQKVDVRILGATRRDLDREVQNGRFRDDLFFRLAVARLELPPLRRRHGDVGLLARHFWDALGGAERPIPYELFERFEESSWPGNVRELYNAVARALALGELWEFDSGATGDDTPKPRAPVDWVELILEQDLPLPRAKQRMLSEFERRYVERILNRTDGDVQKAAAQSGIARRYFNLLRARHGTRSD